jgi:uncharacterized protein YxeA
MSKTKIFFIILILLLLAVGGYFIFNYYFTGNNNPNNPTANNKPAFFGFDQNAIPTGTSTNNNTYNNNNLNQNTDFSTGTSSLSTVAPRLRLISAAPVAGGDFIIQNVVIGTTTRGRIKNIPITAPFEFIRYILRGNGNIYETSTSTQTSVRISNKTIPQLQEAFFNKTGDSVIIRKIAGDDGIQTRLAQLEKISATSTDMVLVLSDLAPNITSISMSPSKSQIFYIKNLGQRGTISNLDGSKSSFVFDSVFREWLTQWAGTKSIFLNTKPSEAALGYLYNLDLTTGIIKKIVGGVTGLTSLVSNDASNLIYTSTDGGSMEMFVHNIKDTSERMLPEKTLPEKCVWGNKNTSIIYCAVPRTLSYGNYPDDWYMGLVHFNDDLWKIDLKTGLDQLILSPDSIVNVPFDMVNLKLSANDDYLMFTEKNTLSLWGYQLVVATSTSPVATTTHNSI